MKQVVKEISPGPCSEVIQGSVNFCALHIELNQGRLLLPGKANSF